MGRPRQSKHALLRVANTPCSIFDSFLNNLGYLLHALHPSTHTHSLDRTDSALACSVLSTPLSRTLILEPSRFYPLVNLRAKAYLSVRVVGLAYISWFLGRAHVVGACGDPGYPGGESEKKIHFPSCGERKSVRNLPTVMALRCASCGSSRVGPHASCIMGRCRYRVRRAGRARICGIRHTEWSTSSEGILPRSSRLRTGRGRADEWCF